MRLARRAQLVGGSGEPVSRGGVRGSSTCGVGHGGTGGLSEVTPGQHGPAAGVRRLGDLARCRRRPTADRGSTQQGPTADRQLARSQRQPDIGTSVLLCPRPLGQGH